MQGTIIENILVTYVYIKENGECDVVAHYVLMSNNAIANKIWLKGSRSLKKIFFNMAN